MLAEDGGEVGEVGEADGVGDLGDVDLLLTQEAGGLLQTDVADELRGGDAGHLLHLAVELGTADTHLLTEHLDVEVAIAEVLVHRLHDALHEQLVVALHLGRLEELGLLLSAAVLTLQVEARVDEVLDVHAQLLHIEGLGEEGIGTALQTLQAVADVGLGGKHDDGYMRQIEVGLDHAEHGEAVHLGHHDVADDEVVGHVVLLGREQLLQALAAVVADAELIVVRQLGGDIAADLLVVVDDEHATHTARRAQQIGGGRSGDILLGDVGLGLRLFDLLGLQMGIAQGQGDGEHRTLHAVGAVGGCYLAVVHVDNHLAEVQSDTRAVDMEAARVAALIEAVEDMLQSLAVDTAAGVADFETCLLVGGAETQADGAAVGGVLEGVGEEVDDDLVELSAVYPDVELVEAIVQELVLDAALLGVVVEHLGDAGHEADEVGLLAMEVHLLLVDLSHVENLVDEVQDALCVTLDGVEVATGLLLLV